LNSAVWDLNSFFEDEREQRNNKAIQKEVGKQAHGNSTKDERRARAPFQAKRLLETHPFVKSVLNVEIVVLRSDIMGVLLDGVARMEEPKIVKYSIREDANSVN
jgi:hypothetical protein